MPMIDQYTSNFDSHEFKRADLYDTETISCMGKAGYNSSVSDKGSVLHVTDMITS